MLWASSKLYKHPKAATLYLTIPSDIVKDSTFVFKTGDEVYISYDPDRKIILVKKKET